MEAQSNLYWLCFTYRYTAPCVYKTILIVDIIGGLAALAQAINYLVKANFKGFYPWVFLVISLLFLYLAYRSIRLLIDYNNNLSSGTLPNETDEYLKVRIWTVYLYFILAIALPALVVLDLYLLGNQASAQSGTQGVGTLLILLVLPFLIMLMIAYGIAGWTQSTFQRSLAEAKDVLGGSSSNPQKGQLL